MRQRGAAMLYVMVMLAAITVVWVATSTLATSSVTTQTRRENRQSARVAMDGIIERLKADAIAGNLSLPAVRTYTLGVATWSVTVTDNGSTLARTMKVVATSTIGGKSYSDTRIVAFPFSGNVLYYTLFTNSDLTLSNTLTTGSNGANGDIGSNGKIVLSDSGSDIEGDVDSVGTQTIAGTVNGTKWAGAPALTFPSPVDWNYYWAADYQVWWGSVVGKSFFSVFGHYPLYYNHGDLSIEGTITGCGVIYVDGSLTLTNDLVYGNSASHVAFVIKGDLRLKNQVANFVGYYFVGANLTTNGSSTKTLVSGAIAANAEALNCNFKATYDPLIFNTPSEGVNLRLPGFWP